jgi:hypothetical protein
LRLPLPRCQARGKAYRMLIMMFHYSRLSFQEDESTDLTAMIRAIGDPEFPAGRLLEIESHILEVSRVAISGLISSVQVLQWRLIPPTCLDWLGAFLELVALEKPAVFDRSRSHPNPPPCTLPLPLPVRPVATVGQLVLQTAILYVDMYIHKTESLLFPPGRIAAVSLYLGCRAHCRGLLSDQGNTNNV